MDSLHRAEPTTLNRIKSSNMKLSATAPNKNLDQLRKTEPSKQSIDYKVLRNDKYENLSGQEKIAIKSAF